MAVVLRLNTVSIPKIGTFGTLLGESGLMLCRTVEAPWRNNAPSKSCVPEGLYGLEKHDSPRYGKGRWHLISAQLGVGFHEGLRTHCLFHQANYPKNVKGCIGPGKEFMLATWGVTHSRDTLMELEAYLDQLAQSHKNIVMDIKRAHA